MNHAEQIAGVLSCTRGTLNVSRSFFICVIALAFFVGFAVAIYSVGFLLTSFSK